MSGCTVGMIVSRWDVQLLERQRAIRRATGTPYRNCVHFIDCLTSPFPSSQFLK